MTTPRQHDAVNALAIRSDSVPSSSKSTLQQRVLSEEEYTGTLSRLIERDFFPHLARLEAENDYLEAVGRTDEPGGRARLEAAVRRLVAQEERVGLVPPTPMRRASGTQDTSIDDIGWTPRTEVAGDTPRHNGQWDVTPMRAAAQDDKATSRREGAVALTLPDSTSIGSFQMQYTSEDNASFLELLEKGQRRRREAYKWAYLTEEEANKKRRQVLDNSRKEAETGFQTSLENAAADVQRRLAAGNQLKLITSSGEQEVPQAAPPINTAKTSSESRDDTHHTNSWAHRARNALFYGPDADRATTRKKTSSLPRKPTKADIDEFLANDRADRTPGINFANTRLREEEEIIADSPRSSRIDRAIGGWLSSSSADGSQAPASEAGDDMMQTPRVAGYSFVSPLPSPRPGDRGEERAQQLMTWGENTPRAGTKGSQEEVYDGTFRMPPTPRRDALARQLADKAGAGRKRPSGSLRHALVGATPSTSKRTRAHDLSPAARTLLDRTTKSTTLGNSLLGSRVRANAAFVTPSAERVAAAKAQHDKLRRERWTPSPRS